MLEQIGLIMKALPWAAPSVVAGAILGLMTMAVFPRRRSASDRIGFALLTWCLTVALVVTLSPVRNDYFGVPSIGCDWSIWRPLDYHYWFRSGSRPPNVWLFLPAGVGVMLLDRWGKKLFGAMVLGALPPAIELIQDRYPQLKRSCSSQDVIDNWTGLALGVVAGFLLALLIGVLRYFRRRRERREAILSGDVRDDALRSDDGFDADDTAVLDAGQANPEHDETRLPLSGRPRARYREFSDFDDRPVSTRWYEQPDDPQAYPYKDRDAADGPAPDPGVTRPIRRREH